MKEALEQKKSAFSALQEKYSATENSLRLAEQSQKRQEEYIDNLKKENLRKQKDLESKLEDLKEQLRFVEQTHKEALQVRKSELMVTEKKNKELENELLIMKNEYADVTRLLKEREIKNNKLITDTEKIYTDEIESLKSEHSDRRQRDLQKQTKLEDAQVRLEEEVSQLKSKVCLL